MQRVVGCVTRFQSGRLTRPRSRTISSCPMPCRQLRLRTDQHPHSIQRCWPGRRRDRDHSRKPEVKLMRLEFDASKMWAVATSVDGVTAAGDVHLKAGDALLFVDAIMHGSAARINPGQRRMAVYRYGSSWRFFRHNYRPNEALLNRLTPTQHQIVMPHKPPQLPPDG